MLMPLTETTSGEGEAGRPAGRRTGSVEVEEEEEAARSQEKRVSEEDGERGTFTKSLLVMWNIGVIYFSKEQIFRSSNGQTGLSIIGLVIF